MVPTARYLLQALLVAVAIALSGCAHSTAVAQDSFAAEDEALDSIERCLAAVEAEVRPALSSPPQFSGIREAATWTRARLPNSLGSAFDRAGAVVRVQMEGAPLGDYAKDRKRLEQMLYSATVGELHKFKGCAGDDVIIVPDKLRDEFYLGLGLGKQPIASEFARLGLGDSYETKKAFMLMLTLDASGVQWDEHWLARSPSKTPK